MCQLPDRACPHRDQEVLVQTWDRQAAECRAVRGNIPGLLCMDHTLRCTQGLGQKPDEGRRGLWHCVSWEHMASLPKAGAVNASADGGQWGCVPRVTRTCSF